METFADDGRPARGLSNERTVECGTRSYGTNVDRFDEQKSNVRVGRARTIGEWRRLGGGYRLMWVCAVTKPLRIGRGRARSTDHGVGCGWAAERLRREGIVRRGVPHPLSEATARR